VNKEGVTPYQQTVSDVSADPRIAECRSIPRKQFIEFLPVKEIRLQG